MYRPRRRDATGWIVFLILLVPAAFGGGWYCGREHFRHELKQTMREAAEAFQQGFRDGLRDNAAK